MLVKLTIRNKEEENAESFHFDIFRPNWYVLIIFQIFFSLSLVRLYNCKSDEKQQLLLCWDSNFDNLVLLNLISLKAFLLLPYVLFHSDDFFMSNCP
jgi:hypothetical protein